MLNMISYGINASSRINDVDAAQFSASVSCEGNGNFSVSSNVYDQKAYSENKEQCDQDFNDFRDKVTELAHGSDFI